MKNHHRIITIFSLLLLLAPAAVLAQIGFPGGMQGIQRDPLARLKRALSEAGAPALTSDQEQQLNTLITNFRSAHATRPTPSATILAAHRALQSAILSGDSTTAQAQIDILSNERVNVARTELKDRANFEIQALAVLKTNDDQVSLLSKQFGIEGLLHLLGSLAHGGFPGFAGVRSYAPSLSFESELLPPQ